MGESLESPVRGSEVSAGPTAEREGRFSSFSPRVLQLREDLQGVVMSQHKLCGSPCHRQGPCGSLPAWREGCSTAQAPSLKLRIFSLRHLRLRSGGGSDDRSVTPWVPALLENLSPLRAIRSATGGTTAFISPLCFPLCFPSPAVSSIPPLASGLKRHPDSSG